LDHFVFLNWVRQSLFSAKNQSSHGGHWPTRHEWASYYEGGTKKQGFIDKFLLGDPKRLSVYQSSLALWSLGVLGTNWWRLGGVGFG